MGRKRTPLEKEVDKELISKGKGALKDFDESQTFHVPARRRETKLISIRLPMDMIRQLRGIASRRGDIGYQQLIKLYLAEALSRTESELQVHMGQFSQQQAFIVRDISLASSSLGAEIGFPDYEEVGEVNQFQVQGR